MTAAILATVLFSLSAVSGKRLSHHLSGVEANFWRFLLSALLLGAYAHSFGLGLGGGALGLFFVSVIAFFFRKRGESGTPAVVSLSPLLCAFSSTFWT